LSPRAFTPSSLVNRMRIAPAMTGERASGKLFRQET
jgi:hypothetical protein